MIARREYLVGLLLCALAVPAFAQPVTEEQLRDDLAKAVLKITLGALWMDTSEQNHHVLKIYVGGEWINCINTSDPDVSFCAGALVNKRTAQVVNLPPEFMKGYGR